MGWKAVIRSIGWSLQQIVAFLLWAGSTYSAGQSVFFHKADNPPTGVRLTFVETNSR